MCNASRKLSHVTVVTNLSTNISKVASLNLEIICEVLINMLSFVALTFRVNSIKG